MANRLTLQEFISRARQVHGNKYEYDKVVYVNAHTDITITCLYHGDFEQEPTNHIHNKRGCPVCAYGGTDEERFWSFVDKDGKQVDYVIGRCWKWLGSINKHNGYGRFWIDNDTVMAHRYSYELHVGKIPNNLLVLHKCDNPDCTNPEHLFLGTNLDNVRDKISKGRNANQSGENNPRAKLKENEVIEIRQLYSTGYYLQKELAIMFNTPLSSINQIITGKRWKYLIL
jgi:hypothetical protein